MVAAGVGEKLGSNQHKLLQLHLAAEDALGSAVAGSRRLQGWNEAVRRVSTAVAMPIPQAAVLACRAMLSANPAL